jgi:excisionase family DNA binding protein
VTQLLTIHELADHLSVSTRTVDRYVRRGQIPFVRLPGRSLRFRADAVEEWITRRTVTPRQTGGRQ